jgi:FKBP-type peptidyl-prolyl cis-trans isomerase 2
MICREAARGATRLDAACGKRGVPVSNVGKKVKCHYRGTLDDGTQFDSSYDRGEPLAFTCGAGQMIPGFDFAVADMQLGEKKTVHLAPKEAYGEHDDQLVFTLRREEALGMERIAVGDQVGLRGPAGQLVPAHVVEVTPAKIVVDANHELAGKPLNFDIELVEVEGETA